MWGWNSENDVKINLDAPVLLEKEAHFHCHLRNLRLDRADWWSLSIDKLGRGIWSAYHKGNL